MRAIFLTFAVVPLIFTPIAAHGADSETPEQCFAIAAASGLSAIEVAGGVTRKDNGPLYTLSIDYRPAASALIADGVEVWAEPSHTPLFRGSSSPLPEAEPKSLGTEPLAVVNGLTGAFSQKLVLPYTPSKGLTDRKVVVKMRVGAQTLLIASANVNVGQFKFTSTFDMLQNSSGVYAIGTYRHCCSGARCGQICTSCNGPFFTCDLINCDINCDQPF